MNNDIAVGLIANMGGVRGQQIARYMQRIEERTGQPISQLCDLMAFISTGGIQGSIVNVPDPAAPAKPLYKSRYGVLNYYKQAETAFQHRRFATLRQCFGHARFDPRPYEMHLDRVLRDTRVKDCMTSVMYYAIDVGTRDVISIRHIKDRSGRTIDENLSGMFLKHVVRGTTTAHTYHPVGTFPTNPDRPGSRNISLQDAGAASGIVPHEVWHTLGEMRPGARRVIINLDTSFAVHPDEMTPEKYNGLGLLGYFVNGEKQDHFLTTTFNGPARKSVRFLQELMGEDFYNLNGQLDPANPRHPTPHLADGRKSNMRRHIAFADDIIARPEIRFDEMCNLLSSRFEPRTEKSGVHLSSRPPPPDNDNLDNLIVLPGAFRR
jgi:hypothetical protein